MHDASASGWGAAPRPFARRAASFGGGVCAAVAILARVRQEAGRDLVAVVVDQHAARIPAIALAQACAHRRQGCHAAPRHVSCVPTGQAASTGHLPEEGATLGKHRGTPRDQRNTGSRSGSACLGVWLCVQCTSRCPHGLARAPQSFAVRCGRTLTRAGSRVCACARTGAPSYSVPPKKSTSVPSFLCLYIETACQERSVDVGTSCVEGREIFRSHGRSTIAAAQRCTRGAVSQQRGSIGISGGGIAAPSPGIAGRVRRYTPSRSRRRPGPGDLCVA